MRLTSASLFGLLVAVAPLGTIADSTLPADTSEACALLANRTPEEFASTLADLENQAKLDPTRDQAEIDEFLAQVQSLPVENLQAEVDKTCAAQAQAPKISRSRIARRQDLGGTLGGVNALGSVGDALGGALGSSLGGVAGGSAVKKARNENARRQDIGGTVGGVTGALPGGLGSAIDSSTGTAGGALGGGLGVKKARNENARRQDIGGTVSGVTDTLPGGLGDTVNGVVDDAEKGAGTLSRRQIGGSLAGLNGDLGGQQTKKGGLMGGVLIPGLL
ncbi:hypothetical protein RJ035_001822 [Blastomyces gilchristii]